MDNFGNMDNIVFEMTTQNGIGKEVIIQQVSFSLCETLENFKVNLSFVFQVGCGEASAGKYLPQLVTDAEAAALVPPPDGVLQDISGILNIPGSQDAQTTTAPESVLERCYSTSQMMVSNGSEDHLCVEPRLAIPPATSREVQTQSYFDITLASAAMVTFCFPSGFYT